MDAARGGSRQLLCGTRARQESGETLGCFATYFIERQHSQLQAITRAGLVEDALQVPLDRVLADIELFGDFFVLHSTGYAECDLAFAFGEARQRGRRLGCTAVLGHAAED